MRLNKADKILLILSWLSKNFPIAEESNEQWRREVHVYVERTIKIREKGIILGRAYTHRDVNHEQLHEPAYKEKQIFVLGTSSMHHLEDIIIHEWAHHRRGLAGDHDDQFWLEYGRIYRERLRWTFDDNYSETDRALPLSDKFELHIDKSLGLKFSGDWSKDVA